MGQAEQVRCSLCPGCNPIVPGYGPERADYLFVGEAPGRDENRVGIPFVGKTGKEFTEHYLPLAGIHPLQIFKDNAVSCLRADTSVVLDTGIAKPIYSLVSHEYRGLVRSWDPNSGEIINARVTNTYRNKRGSREFLRLQYASYRPKGGGTGGTILTTDHPVLTKRGWVQARDLSPEDMICTGTPGLSKRQMGALVGTVLGDAHIGGRSLHISQGYVQKEWVELKSLLFSNLGMSPPHYAGSKCNTFRSVSRRLPLFENLNRHSILDKPLDELVDIFGLFPFCILFLDDGFGHKKNRGFGLKQFEVALMDFTEPQRRKLAYVISTSLEVDAYERSGRIYLRADDSRRVAGLIAPMVPDSMRYKLRGIGDDIPFDRSWYNPDNEPFWDKAVITPAEKRDPKNNERTVYCLDVEGTHNFLTIGGIVHNCLPPGNGKLDPSDPKDLALIRCCAKHHLYKEIERRQPKLIIPMGGVACSLIPGLDLEHHYAMPFVWDIPDLGEYTIFPMWHPALGLHSPKEMLKIRNSFIRLKKYIRGELKVPVDRYPDPDYTVLNTVGELDDYFQQHTDLAQDPPEIDLALDTEITHKGEPFCLTFSICPGTGRLILAGNKIVLKALDWWINNILGKIIVHNRLFDRPIVMRMGVNLPHKRITDTMMAAYHLGNMPQGLKTLGYRYLGCEMQSFDDLVTPYSTAKCLAYLAGAVSATWSKPEKQRVRDDDGNWKDYRPQSFSTKLKRFFTDYGKNPNIDLFERWDGWEMHHGEIEKVLGEWPGKCISHVPFHKTTHYACGDPARTLELWPIQKRAERLVRRKPEYEWYD